MWDIFILKKERCGSLLFQNLSNLLKNVFATCPDLPLNGQISDFIQLFLFRTFPPAFSYISPALNCSLFQIRLFSRYRRLFQRQYYLFFRFGQFSVSLRAKAFRRNPVPAALHIEIFFFSYVFAARPDFFRVVIDPVPFVHVVEVVKPLSELQKSRHAVFKDYFGYRDALYKCKKLYIYFADTEFDERRL